MSWQPHASLHALEVRAKLYERIRNYFQSQNVLEVETPAINTYAVTDLQIDSVATERLGFLHTSPEYAMKRLLVAFRQDIYQLCKVFRANENGAFHHHEFTMLEWYRISCNYQQLMQEVSNLVDALLSDTHTLLEPTCISYSQVFMEILNVDIQEAKQDIYLDVCSDHAVNLNTTLTIQQYQELILDQVIVPKLQQNRLVYIYDFPSEQAALAKLNSQGYAQRFELYLNGVELANGFQELTDAREQKLRFEEDNRKRLQQNKKAVEIDELFINALGVGLPECAGVALGVDRLLMLILGAKHIKEVLTFYS